MRLQAYAGVVYTEAAIVSKTIRLVRVAKVSVQRSSLLVVSEGFNI
jgi:hypothetical protein